MICGRAFPGGDIVKLVRLDGTKPLGVEHTFPRKRETNSVEGGWAQKVWPYISVSVAVGDRCVML